MEIKKINNTTSKTNKIQLIELNDSEKEDFIREFSKQYLICKVKKEFKSWFDEE